MDTRKEQLKAHAEKLGESRVERRAFIDEFYGAIPCSILRWNKEDEKKHSPLINLSRRSADIEVNNIRKLRSGRLKDLPPEFADCYRNSNKVCRGKGGYLSVFPQQIGRIVTKFYCPKGGVVFDPFHGHNSRMQLCYSLGLNYIGVDVSTEFYQANLEIKQKLLKQNAMGLVKQNNSITLYNQSSADVPQVENDSADFTVTSPPYWDLEYYGDEPEQLGKNRTYQSFLDALYLHVQENFRVLKPGAFACWFVNDFVKNKVFYPYHADLIQLFIQAGFVLHTINIVDLGRSLETVFVKSIKAKKRFPKIHEFCMVFRKPAQQQEEEEGNDESE